MKTAALLVLGALVLSACGDGETPEQKKVGAAIDKWTAEPDGDGSVAGEFKKDFPDQWSNIRHGLEVNFATAGDVSNAKADALNQVSGFMKDHLGDMAKASDASLDAFFDEQRTLLNNTWGVNVETCAHIASGGLKTGDVVGKFGPDVFADKRLQLKLMHEGASHPATHPAFAWTPAEQARIDQVFRKDNIKIPKEGMSGADYVVQCVGAVDVAEIVKTLPGDRKAAFEADQIAQHAKAAK